MKKAVRAFILSRARDVFQEKGFANATVDDIAVAAEVSKPTLYNYFSGKQEIFLAVLEDLHAGVAELIQPYVDNHRQEFPQRLRRMAAHVAKIFFRQQGLVRIMMAERRLISELFEQCTNGKDHKKPLFMHGEIYRAFVAFFRSAMDAKELNANSKPEILASMYIGMMGQISLNQVICNWSETEFLNAVDSVVDVFCYGAINIDAMIPENSKGRD